jgi:hypothetical protein
MYLNEDPIAVDVPNQSSVLVYSIYMDQKRAPLHKTVQGRLGLLAVRLTTLRCIHTPVRDQFYQKLTKMTNQLLTSLSFTSRWKERVSTYFNRTRYFFAKHSVPPFFPSDTLRDHTTKIHPLVNIISPFEAQIS